MVALSRIADDPQLRLRRIVVPRPDVEVRWVTASELVDPTPFLEGGEFLLTTGLGAKDWSAEWGPYVERLAARRVAALGLGTGLTHQFVPDELVAACQERGVNLIEVPQAATFVAVSRTVVNLLDAEARRADKEAVERQRRFIAIAGRPDAMETMLEELADVVGGAAAVVDRFGHPVAGPCGKLPDGFGFGSIASQVADLRLRTKRSASSVDEAGVNVEIQPLGSGDRATQFLAIVALAAAVGRTHRSAVTTVVALLSLAVDGNNQQLKGQRELRAKALSFLVQGEVDSAKLMLVMLERQARLPRPARFIRGAGTPEALADGLLQAERRNILAARRGNELELLVPARERFVTEFLPALVTAGLRLGISPPFAHEDAARGHERAGHALGDASAATQVVWWQDIVRKGAGGILDSQVAEAWAASYLEGLDPVLRETLASFLRHHGSRGKVGEELRVHRNTVRTRLAHIEKILGASLDDPDTRADAWMALRLQAR